MPRWNPYRSACPTRLILDRIADKWAVLLLSLLAQEPMRFNQLKREVDGISQKMLSQSLKALERDGLVTRKATPTVPVTVEYAITPLGATLAATVEPLRTWAESHIEQVLKAQRRYDSASAREQGAAARPVFRIGPAGPAKGARVGAR